MATLQPHTADDLREHISALLRGQTAGADVNPQKIEDIVEATWEHGVSTLLYARLNEITQPGGYVESLRNALKPDAFKQAVCETVVANEVKTVASKLSENNIAFLLLKGTSLAYSLYAQPFLRPRLDIDILITQEDRVRTKALLNKLGFSPQPGIDGTLATHQFMLSRDAGSGLDVTLDIHWKLTNPQVFAHLFEFDELYRERQNIKVLGPNAYAPCPLHLLTHALIHRVAHHHERDRLIWLYDIYLLGEVLDHAARQQFVTLCKTKKINTVCLDGIQAAHKAFGGIKLERLIQLLETNVAQADENYTSDFLQPGFNQIDQFRSDWKNCSWPQRWQLLNEHCFPPSAYMRQRYGSAPLALLYARRFGNGVKKLFGVL